MRAGPAPSVHRPVFSSAESATMPQQIRAPAIERWTMPLTQIACPHCRWLVIVPEHKPGEAVPCPACKSPIHAVGEPAEVEQDDADPLK